MTLHVKCFAMKRTKEGREYVDVEWHPRSGSFPSMDAAVAACRDGHHAEHAHEVKQS